MEPALVEQVPSKYWTRKRCRIVGLVEGMACKPSWPHTMSRPVSRTSGFRFAGHQHRWMSSAARGHTALDT